MKAPPTLHGDAIEDLVPFFGITRQRISELMREGKVRGKDPEGYNVYGCLDDYHAIQREAAAGRGSDGDLDLVQERARLAKEQADKTAMDNADRRAETLTRSDVVAMVQTSQAHARAKFLSVPSKLAAILASLDNPRAIEDRLTAAIHECLAELANTRWVSKPECEPSGSGSPDGSDPAMGPAAPPNRKRVGRPKPKAKSRIKLRARKLGHKQS